MHIHPNAWPGQSWTSQIGLLVPLRATGQPTSAASGVFVALSPGAPSLRPPQNCASTPVVQPRRARRPRRRPLGQLGAASAGGRPAGASCAPVVIRRSPSSVVGRRRSTSSCESGADVCRAVPPPPSRFGEDVTAQFLDEAGLSMVIRSPPGRARGSGFDRGLFHAVAGRKGGADGRTEDGGPHPPPSIHHPPPPPLAAPARRSPVNYALLADGPYAA